MAASIGYWIIIGGHGERGEEREARGRERGRGMKYKRKGYGSMDAICCIAIGLFNSMGATYIQYQT